MNLFEGVSHTLFKNRDALSPHYTPRSLPFREEQITTLSRKIAPILSGRKPENIFIYGKTGTGKTAVTKRVLSDLNEYAEKNNISVKGFYINGRLYETGYKILVKLVRFLNPGENLMGYSMASVYDRLLEIIDERGMRVVVALDEIDMVKKLSDLIYRLTRANDELEKGSVSVIGISNNPRFKEGLDARTRSALCEVELVFPPYNAEQLKVILHERVKEAFREGVVEEEAIHLAAAVAARHSGDARYALLLLLRAGDLAEEEGAEKVTREYVERARRRVEEDVAYEMISTLPDQLKAVLIALARLQKKGKGVASFGGGSIVTSGMLYDMYKKVAEELGMSPVSDRWFREYLNELETYGLITVRSIAKGMRGNTRAVELTLDADRVERAALRSL